MEEYNVVVGVLRQDDYFAFVQRTKYPFKGLFCFPGGKVKEKESPDEAMGREVLEETGLSITRKELVGSCIETILENGEPVLRHYMMLYNMVADPAGKLSSSKEGVVCTFNMPFVLVLKKVFSPSDYRLFEMIVLEGMRKFNAEFDVSYENRIYRIEEQRIIPSTPQKIAGNFKFV